MTLFDTFKLRAEAVSAEVHRFPQKSEALDFILQYVQTADAGALWADCPFLAGLDKQLSLRRSPASASTSPARRLPATKIGISQLDWAMANTGTLVQDAAPVDRRLVSTLPSIHIAVIETDRLVPDMPALFSKIRPEQTNYISFITGPSRTADIERVLTIGVHGPEKLIIVFVDEAARVN